ncbi:superoxide dismutase [Mn] [Sphaerosporella brunnea]|uniref:Superoxide dismutase n=1 Tax=Sphaerosporella brunnea TaxID=1250544 RepID=A0A5J5EPJ1_9PEZI|nr:superoxide dismutase [Mn] [Sphaerosporella brunnea]
MQFSSLLFVQLPAFLSNLTNPSGPTPIVASSPSIVTSSASTMAAEAPKVAVAPLEKYMLPPLPYKYHELEPYISEQIMKLHHDKHHRAYVDKLNAAMEAHVKALAVSDVKAQIELQQAIKFNGGGHINHALFWPSLCPPGLLASEPNSAPLLIEALTAQFGSFDAFKERFKVLLLALQGSGWGWLVKTQRNVLELRTTKDQDPVTDDVSVILGIDMWEHAYYLQYWNDKASYVDGIWNIINWELLEARYDGTAAPTAL